MGMKEGELEGRSEWGTEEGSGIQGRKKREWERKVSNEVGREWVRKGGVRLEAGSGRVL